MTRPGAWASPAWQALWQVEVPNGLPLILAGIRSAANQVIATATVAGFVGLGTLGVFIYTAASTQQYDVMAGASIAVIILVLAVEAPVRRPPAGARVRGRARPHAAAPAAAPRRSRPLPSTRSNPVR